MDEVTAVPVLQHRAVVVKCIGVAKRMKLVRGDILLILNTPNARQDGSQKEDGHTRRQACMPRNDPPSHPFYAIAS
jgi:hypothetical protein